MPLFDSFRAARWVRTLNLLLQAILFLTLFAGLNYLSRNHAWRFDLTQQRRYSLSAETLGYLHDLPRPVRIIVTITEDSEDADVKQAFADVRGLLREYTYATEDRESGKVLVEYLDVYQRRREAEQLGIDQADCIILDCAGKRRVVMLNEIYQVERGRKKAFQGEQAITSAILDVSSPEKKKIYFITGHGELSPDNVDPVNGLSAIREALRQRNFDVETVNLAKERRVPDKAALLVAVWPQGAFRPLEQELLRQYLLANAGRLILLLAPRSPHGLENLLSDWGILVDDDVIYDTGTQNMTEEGDLLLRDPTPHPVTQTLIDYHLEPHIGPARSVRPDPGRSMGNGFNVTTLAAASPTAWGEVSYRLHSAQQYDPGVDIRPPPGTEPKGRLGVVVASERVDVRDGLPFSVRGGRLVVFGTGDLIANNRAAIVDNLTVFLGAVNWTVERDANFNMPARPIEHYQLSLSAGELTRLRYSLLLALPGAAALLGLIVYWTRRS